MSFLGKIMRILLIRCLLTYIAFLNPVFAILTIEITGGREEGGHPIAIVPFKHIKQKNSTVSISKDLARIISDDLYRSGRFSPMPRHRLPEQPFQSRRIQFRRWQAVEIPHLVIGRITSDLRGEYTVGFELLDVFKRQRIVGFRYTAITQTLRQVAHQISDDIYKALTGERGVFNTLIVYVISRRHEKQTPYHLYIADADGANPRLMLKSREPVLSPSWSPDRRHIAYVTYENIKQEKRMCIYRQEIRTGKRTLLSSEPGLNAAPAWAPDGKRLALTLSKDGNPEIYILTLRDRTLTRFTHHNAIDTEAEWAPDGKSLVFTSARSGKPHIYRKSVKGGKVQRLTSQGIYNARPRFSPDGRKLALIHSSRSDNGFQIAVLNLKNGQLKVLTKTTADESPSFSPNGGMIIYATGSELAAVSTDGRIHQRLSVNMSEEVREPAWAPFYKYE